MSNVEVLEKLREAYKLAGELNQAGIIGISNDRIQVIPAIFNAICAGRPVTSEWYTNCLHLHGVDETGITITCVL